MLSESYFDHHEIWRIVEARHLISTMKLVDSLSEHELLEEILEESKPPVPASAADLHYFLSTPFRYFPLSGGSRFRAENDPGVWYGAESMSTAAAEMSYRRWGFIRDAVGLDHLPSAQYTVFSDKVSGETVNLRKAPFDRFEQNWSSRGDYGATQAFARIARDLSIDIIIYRSVRDPESRSCYAVLNPESFQSTTPENIYNCCLTVLPGEAVWHRQGSDPFAFDTSAWS